MTYRTGPGLLVAAMVYGVSVSAFAATRVGTTQTRSSSRSALNGHGTFAWLGAAIDTVSDRRPARDTTPITTADAPPPSTPWLRAFELRSKSNKLGYFLNEQQIEAMHPQYTSDALRRVPGVVVLPSRGIGNVVRIRNCTPLVWVDGQRAPGVELDEVTHGSDVAALEVYRSLAGVPAEFTDRSATCGTILVWMKSG